MEQLYTNGTTLYKWNNTNEHGHPPVPLDTSASGPLAMIPPCLVPTNGTNNSTQMEQLYTNNSRQHHK